VPLFAEVIFMSRVQLPFAVLVVVLIGSVHAEEVSSGPKAGDKVAALKLLVATGENAGKEIDLAAERKEKPTVFIFIDADQFSRPIARYLKVLDGAVNTIGNDAHIVAVWLTSDQEKTKAYLPKAQMSLSLEATTLAQFPGAKSGPDGWAINDRALVTTVVANKEKVTANFAYVSVNETDVRKVAAEVRKAVGEGK
jgi:hypothetical protein